MANTPAADLVVHGGLRPVRHRSARYRPQLEPLECRTAPATDLVVASLLDAPDANPLDGVAASTLPGGVLTLRAAIMHANANPAEEFRILLPAGTITLTIAGIDEDQAAQGDLDIRVRLTIQGQAGSVVNADRLDRVFEVLAGPAATVQFRDFTITGGSARTGMEMSADGGGIRVFDTNLDLHRVHVVDNRADLGVGGGIDFFEPSSDPALTLNVRDSAITGNFANFGGGGLSLLGNADLQNVTISGNQIGADTDGGGILQFSFNASLRLFHVTVAANAANAIRNNSDALTIGSSILADNFGGNYNGVQAISLGFNLDTDGSANLNGPGDQVGAANLGPLAFNGGPTPTHALLLGSLALDAANPNLFPPMDQRGVARPINGLPDSGAYEAGPIVTVGGSTGDELDSQNQFFTWLVVDPNPFGVPLAQVTVTRNGVQVFASNDPAGNFDFNALGLGLFRIQVVGTSADGTSTSNSRQTNVRDDDVLPPTINLDGTNGVFSWNVVDASLPLSGVVVTVQQDGNLVFQTGTAAGLFPFLPLGAGTYVLTVQAEDGDTDWVGDSLFATATLTVVVAPPPVVVAPDPPVVPVVVLTAFPVFPEGEDLPTAIPAIFIVLPVDTGTPTGPAPAPLAVEFLFSRFGVGAPPERIEQGSVLLQRIFQESLTSRRGDRSPTLVEFFDAGLPPENRTLRGIYPLSDPVGAVLSPLDADDSVRLVEWLRQRVGPPSTTGPAGTSAAPASGPEAGESAPAPPPAAPEAPGPSPSSSLVPLLPLAAGRFLGRKQYPSTRKRGRPGKKRRK